MDRKSACLATLNFYLFGDVLTTDNGVRCNTLLGHKMFESIQSGDGVIVVRCSFESGTRRSAEQARLEYYEAIEREANADGFSRSHRNQAPIPSALPETGPAAPPPADPFDAPIV